MKKKRQDKTRQEKNAIYLANKDYDRLITNNKPFIKYLAGTFNQTEAKTCDLIQEGEIALWQSATTFDDTKGNFLTYAKFLIINRMKDYLSKYGNTVRTPIQLIRDKEPTKPCHSLNTPINDDGATLEDFIASEVSEEENDYTSLKMALMSLKDKDRVLIEMYYGIGDYENDGPKDYQQVGNHFGCTRQNIQEKIKKILIFLKNDEKLQKTQQDL